MRWWGSSDERRGQIDTAPRDRGAAAGGRRARSGSRIAAVAYYRQDLAQVPAAATLYDIIAHLRPTGGAGPSRAISAAFGFSGDSVQRRAATLSGGERPGWRWR